ncbi:hypothetical protein E2C01_078787 [Portunus trituberculatus]|uniref:Uncharacterized protein n=1 Tax=Portunus trituberculatus TaxID=210409 RepID=A0A5B7IF95_PORTR|nr:hypothetical protein [Portunus trituberculatus]
MPRRAALDETPPLPSSSPRALTHSVGNIKRTARKRSTKRKKKEYLAQGMMGEAGHGRLQWVRVVCLSGRHSPQHFPPEA